jgi:predicted GIY-YIG superfamily endonuclease
MPKVSIDYSKCSIYKIENIDNSNLVYIGHTTSFNKRKGKHKSNCNNEKSRQHNYKIYQMIREHGGWDAFRMIEVEKYPCKDKQEAERREYEIIQKLKSGNNTQIMNTHFFHSDEEKLQKQKHYEEYKRNKMLFDECLLELDFMT